MNILGISAYYHDSAAALVRDGQIIAAAQEERFTRLKHDPGFPKNSIAYCLRAGGVDPSGIDAVAFYEKPITRFIRLIKTYSAVSPRGFRSFKTALPQWLRTKLWITYEIERNLRRRLPMPSEMYFTSITRVTPQAPSTPHHSSRPLYSRWTESASGPRRASASGLEIT